jgi:GTP-binding protein
MKITSAEFVGGVVGTDPILEDGRPQVAFIGRSNVGKSSTINFLTNNKGLARTSSLPGKTTEINVFLINGNLYLLDLPGYGFAEGNVEKRQKILDLIRWYLVDSGYVQKKVVLIIDAEVGPTEKDLEILRMLEEQGKEIVIAANKIDKIGKSRVREHLKKISEEVNGHRVLPYSAKEGIGIRELLNEILG